MNSHAEKMNQSEICKTRTKTEENKTETTGKKNEWNSMNFGNKPKEIFMFFQREKNNIHLRQK